ncbi:hypothetical protein ElyMa_002947500 [Elysia marginata]|uniref:Uncharacterized protein n=1 Tax=Elysia marginata TaxID=1093978 RepID=A0AAV4I8J8_9GAST|nr:hypothetical protein ElyMa_002947500 [Elysia marginata]
MKNRPVLLQDYVYELFITSSLSLALTNQSSARRETDGRRQKLKSFLMSEDANCFSIRFISAAFTSPWVSLGLPRSRCSDWRNLTGIDSRDLT